MNVLSLFDGMSCGQIALNKLGINYDKYFACEIDKYAMEVTQHNFPDTIQMGDVQFVTKETFGTHKIDLIMGGSPCQGFSFAGKQLNFDDPRSALFFEFVRLVKELKPKYFLLENVVMKQEYQDVISKYMGCEPIKINSALVSAQTRKRLYWTNIPGIEQPEDKRIILKDIIEREIPGEYEPPYVKLNGKDSGCIGYVGNEPKQATKIYSDNGKSRTLIANAGGQGGKTGLYQIENKDDVKCDMVINQGKELHKEDIDKSHCLLARDYKGFPNQPFTGVRIEQVDDKVELNENQQNKIEKINNVNPDKANCLTEAIGRGGSSAEYLTSVKKKTDAVEQANDKPIKVGNIYPSGGQNGNVYSEDGKSPSILAGTGNKGTGVGSCNAPKIEQVGDKLRHPEATKKGYAEAGEDEGLDLTFPDSKTRRGRSMKDKSNCLTAASQEMGVVESFEVSEKRKKIIEKNLGDRINDETEIIGSSQKNAYVGKDKSSSLTSAMGEGGGHVPMLKIDPSKPNQINPDKSAKSSSEDEKGTQPHMQDRVFHEDGKSHALTSSFASRTKVGKNDKKLSWRKLTPLECERLQTVPDGYTLVMEDGKQKVSNSQRYKMLGNGWTVDVIAHIFKNIPLT